MKLAKKYILYLEWFEAEKFYYRYRNEIQIEYCIADMRGTYPLKTFHDIPVLGLDVFKLKKEKKIIIVCSENYPEVKKFFLRIGLNEFQHFIPSGLLGRKMVIMHGNCYMVPLMEYIMKIKEFREKYYIYSIPLICNNSEHEISEDLLQVCDVFIHQNIHTKTYGEKLTDKWIIPKLPEQCLEIVIPNFMGIYGGGVFFYPQCIGTEYRKRLIMQGNEIFVYTDYYIEDCYRSGMSEEEISRKIRSKELFDSVFIQDIFDNSMLDLLEREKKWDVKITDYFLETYRIKQFFLDPGHPADHVIKEIAVRVVEKLGISIDKTNLEDLDNEMLNLNEIPTYQCVKDILHLEWEDNFELRKNSYLKLTSDQMNIDEYVKEYIYISKYAEYCVDQYNISVLAKLKHKGRLVIFGAGHWFDDYMQHYEAEYAPDLVVDNDTKKWGSIIYGITIENPQKIQNGDIIIICCCEAGNDIAQQVMAMGIHEIVLYKPDSFIETKVFKDLSQRM